jgi:hypothetical protein
MGKAERSGHQKGAALVIALIMLLLLTLIGISALNTTTLETNIAGNERVYNMSFYAADGGVENFRSRLIGGEFIYTPTTGGSYTLAVKDEKGDKIADANISYQRWTRSEGGLDYLMFKVRSEATPAFGGGGRVTVESVVESPLMVAPGYPGGT